MIRPGAAGIIRLDMDIEEQLRQAILNAPISRADIARQTGVAEAVLSNFVNRKRSVTMTTAAKLAKALRLELMPGRRAKKGR